MKTVISQELHFLPVKMVPQKMKHLKYHDIFLVHMNSLYTVAIQRIPGSVSNSIAIIPSLNRSSEFILGYSVDIKGLEENFSKEEMNDFMKQISLRPVWCQN